MVKRGLCNCQVALLGMESLECSLALFYGMASDAREA